MKSIRKLNKRTKINIVITLLVVVAFLCGYLFDVFGVMAKLGIYAPLGKGLNVIFIDVGKADCTLINADGYNILIDAGIDFSAEEITTIFDRYKIQSLDMVIATHGDTDHIGGMKNIINNYNVDKFVMYKGEINLKSDSQVFSSMLNSLKENNVKVDYVKVGDTFSFGKLELEVISPHYTYEESNDNSLVVKASYGDNKFLFTGDATEVVEEQLLKSKIDLDCDVLKVSHHGSRSATTNAFLNAVSPQIAVVSVGDNTNNLPNIETINRLKTYDGLKLYRTDHNGDIVLSSDGNKITVSTEK